VILRTARGDLMTEVESTDTVGRQRRRDLLINVAHPPLSDRRFWKIQAMVMVILLAQLGVDLLQDHGALSVPDFTVDLLLFIPIIYAGNIFGLSGSLGAALTGFVLLLPDELLLHHSAVEIWAQWSIIFTMFVIAVVMGNRFEVERRQREQLIRAERAKVETELPATLMEVAAQKDLARSEEYFRNAFENNNSGMVITDIGGRLLAVNQSFCQMLGYSADELLGQYPGEFTVTEDRAFTIEMVRRLASGEAQQVQNVLRYVHKNGRVLFGEISAACIRDDVGRPETFIASVRDVTEERSLIAQLEHDALYDPLTGLANRALFDDRLAHARENTERHGGSNAVFLLDLDDFKEVNDTFGHLVGDELLVEFARRLEQVTRATDTLCRFGGDEFLYLALGFNGSFKEIAERLLSVVAEPFMVAGTRLKQHVSIGVVVDDFNGMDNEELLQNADRAMYEAKRQGKGRYVLFASEMHDRASGRLELLRDLRQALLGKEISMHYQPLVDLITEEIIGFEALMRWQHPTIGLVPPEVFIPLAEESDLIVELGSFALDEAITAAASWPPIVGGARLASVSVNLAARQFRDPALPSRIERTLSSFGLAPRRLVLEITESVALANIARTTSVAGYLKGLGVGLALDDFGTGYSSLTYLTRLRPDLVKIDRSFVGMISEDIDNTVLIESIIALGHRLDLTVLAEGIETTGQLEYLRRLGCELGQGYLFSPAVPAEEVNAMLARAPWSPGTAT
jgi:diguanylate cyclase (GGDEF)-like protein/PAS domain S-box-containing protein